MVRRVPERVVASESAAQLEVIPRSRTREAENSRIVKPWAGRQWTSGKDDELAIFSILVQGVAIVDAYII